MKIHLGSRQVGEGEPAFILAEVASAHQGESARALALARSAREAGANGVKFQIFRASELVAPNDSRHATFKQIELSERAWDGLLEEAAGLGIPLLADIFDSPSLAVAEKHGMAGYKIHSTDMENPALIRAVAATGKPLLLSTGGLGLDEVGAALKLARAEGNEQVILLHGVQSFPTRVEDSHLRFIETLKSTFGFPVGFLDHVDGGSPMALLLPALALAFGANLIEKHIILDRKEKGFDWESSLEPGRFKEMVDLLREAERSYGSPEAARGPAAETYHRLMRRAVVSRVALRKGEPLRVEQMALVRNERGLAPQDSGRLLGRLPRRDIPAWEPLTEDLFE